MKKALAAASSVLAATLLAASLSAQVTPRVYSPQETETAPQIDVWLDQVYMHVGDRLRPHFVTDVGAFVTIVKVSSDGQLQVLYPRRPRDQRPFERVQLVNDRSFFNSLDRRFEIDESRGTGFVFAVASFERFNYSYFMTGGDWNFARLSNDSRYGDPFEIVRRFVDRTLSDRADFSMDYVSYEVNGFGAQSRYATRYPYNSYDDFYDSCISAFGYGYTSYCQPYYTGGRYPIIVSRPQSPSPSIPVTGNYAGKHPRPVTGDPVVPTVLTDPQIATGRQPTRDPAEDAALAAHRERLGRDPQPRDRGAQTFDTQPMPREPRVYTPAEPMRQAPQQRAEPRVEYRPEPRVQQSAPARVEVRNEPSPAPAPRIEQTPRATATPVQKDQGADR